MKEVEKLQSNTVIFPVSITQDLNKTERLNMREVCDLKTVIKLIPRDHVKTVVKTLTKHCALRC